MKFKIETFLKGRRKFYSTKVKPKSFEYMYRKVLEEFKNGPVSKEAVCGKLMLTRQQVETSIKYIKRETDFDFVLYGVNESCNKTYKAE